MSSQRALQTPPNAHLPQELQGHAIMVETFPVACCARCIATSHAVVAAMSTNRFSVTTPHVFAFKLRSINTRMSPRTSAIVLER